MKIQRFTLVLALLFSLTSLLSAQEITVTQDVIDAEDFSISENKKPVKDPAWINGETLSPINQAKTKITIKSNVTGALVFINGQYQGKTTLTLNSLPEGTYRLRVEKNGYESAYYRLKIRRGQSETFYVNLNKYQGTINFKADTPGATVEIDGKRVSSSSIKVDEGTHTLEIKKFGYNTKKTQITVHRYSSQTVRYDLTPAQFDISGFKASKKSFNPSLSGNPGSILFTFSVTTKATGTFSILNQFNHEVYSKPLDEFTTWNQSIQWNGKNEMGTAFMNGDYTAVITAEDKKVSCPFTIDSSISIPAASQTAGGSGIGTLPQAFLYPENSLVAGINAGAVLTDSEDTFYCAPLSAHLSMTFSKNVEFSFKGGFLPGYFASPFYNAAIKICGQKKNKDVNVDYGMVLRIGGARNAPFQPYGADTGSGAGGGLLFGLDSESFYAGISSEITYGTSSFAGTEYDSVWKNGIALQYKTPEFAAGVYSALHSSFGTTGLEEDLRTSNDKNWTRAFEAGVDFSLKLDQSSVYYNFRGSTLIFDSIKYYKAEASVSWLL